MLYRKFFVVLIAFFLFFLAGQNITEAKTVYQVRLYIFHMETCPHCREELKYLDELKKKYPNFEVHEFEISKNFANQNLFQQILEKEKLSGNVPTNVIGDKVIVGFDNKEGKGKEIEDRIIECSTKTCSSWLDDTLKLGALGQKEIATNQLTPANDQPSTSQSDLNRVSFNFLGKRINLRNDTSVYIIGTVLGLADGINPCMFSVLIFLLSYLMAIGSKKKALKAGLVFTLTTFIVYFLFMYGILKVVAVLKIASSLRMIVSIIALVIGGIMIKDFFYYGKGISLEISTRFKPTIENLIKKGTIPSAIILALFSSIVELPCTSGLPLAYVTILAQRSLNPFGYLVLYNLFFVLPLGVIIVGVFKAWTKVDEMETWRQKSRKYMRLVAGILLVLLALALWFNWI